MKKLLTLIALFSTVTLSISAQTSYNVTARVSGLEHNFQCGNDVGTGNPDPRWKLWWAYDLGTFTAFTAGADYCTDVYGGNGLSCGLDNSYNLATTAFTNVFLSQFNLDMECWEEDGCGGGSDCTAGGNGLCNGDDIQTPRARIANIDYRNQPPCGEHNWGVFYRLGAPDNYGAEVRIDWSYHTVDPNDIGTIDATGQIICEGQDPSIINSTSPGLPHSTYQWQYSDDNGVTWTDVATGGNALTYDPPPLVATRQYRRRETLCVGNTIATATPTDYYSNVHLITVQVPSVAPTSVVSSPTALCGAGSVILTASGGTLGTGASYEWYDDACGSNLIGTTSVPSLSVPAVATTTTFFVRLNGACNTTGCVQVTVNVTSPSVAPTGAVANNTNICAGDPVTLSVNGGTLGSGSSWEWYSNSCGGVSEGSGSSISVNPTATTTYFVRAEGGCGPTACQSVTINVDQPSTDPTGITASSTVLCNSGSSTLTVNGGSLGTSATWEWYENGCGAGASIGTGNSITVTPSATTTYYVRAEGTCNNTACQNITITVNQSGTDPTGIATASTNLCSGATAVLSVQGGALGTGSTWEWYSGSCGGISEGSGTSISVSPATTTTYYVRGEGACGNTACVNITITIGVGAADPTAATVINDNICPGDTSEIYVTGGTLPSGYTWVWYTGACGAVPIGVGDTIAVTPNATTQYYVRAVGTCGSTGCATTTVTVQDGSLAATGISISNNNFCSGNSTTLSVIGGSLVSGANWMWYESSCGGTSVGMGNSITVTPNSSTTYYVRAEGGTCGNTVCATASVNVLEPDVYIVPFDDYCGFVSPFELNNGLPSGGTYSGPGVTNNIFDPAAAGQGAHLITYTLIDDNGCQATVSDSILIGSSTISASAVVSTQSCSDGGVTLTASASGGSGNYSYQWSNGATTNPLTFVEPGTYSVTVTDETGCAGSVNNIDVSDELGCLELPNTFTPNGDGTNDTWNLDFSTYSTSSLMVYSKWGTLVYESDALTIQWDGNSLNGDALPAGTYYYIIELTGGSSNQTSQNGPITIVR